jgi:hypothetical protein
MYLAFSALMAYRMGDFQDSYTSVQKALALYAAHSDSKELQGLLHNMFTQI